MATKKQAAKQAEKNALDEQKIVLAKAIVSQADEVGKLIAGQDADKREYEASVAKQANDMKGLWINVLDTLCPGNEGKASMIAATAKQEAFISAVIAAAWKAAGRTGKPLTTPPPAKSTDEEKAKYWPSLGVYASWYRKLFRAGNAAHQHFLTNAHFGTAPMAEDAGKPFDAVKYYQMADSWSSLNDRASRILRACAASGQMDAKYAPKLRGAAAQQATGNVTKVLDDKSKAEVFKLAMVNTMNAQDARMLLIAAQRGYAAAMAPEKQQALSVAFSEFTAKLDNMLETVNAPTMGQAPSVNAALATLTLTPEQRAAVEAHIAGLPSALNVKGSDTTSGTLPSEHEAQGTIVAARDEVAAKRATAAGRPMTAAEAQQHAPYAPAVGPKPRRQRKPVAANA